MPSPLDSIDFRDPARAREELARLSGDLPERILARIGHLLASVPDPDTTLASLERFRREAPAAFERFASSPAALQYVLATFSYSRFLSDALIRYPEAVLQLASSGDLYRTLSAEEFRDRLVEFLPPGSAGIPAALDLAHFRRRQLLRIVLRDVLNLASLAEISEELSNLADAILEFSYERIRAELVRRHGEPRYTDENGRTRRCGFAVIALGKLGARELNYSSDIDLMFLYSANGETGGEAGITNKEFFKKVANQITELLSTYTGEGICYRIDLRLRPDGRLGEVCISLGGARTYYQERARDWEKQMLIKARVAAGDFDLGRALLDAVEPLTYTSSLDFSAVEAVSETRARIGEKLAGRRGAQHGLDIKLAPGGIRDIEFLVQCLQRLHGGRETWVRHGGTLLALSRLHDKDLLSHVEYGRLASAYQFLRHLEHRLQFDEDRQTHTLPTDREALDILARKMPADGGGQVRNAGWLRTQLEEHLANVRELYERVIHAQKPMYYTPVEMSPGDPEPGAELPPNAAVNLSRYLDLCAPNLAVTLSSAHIHRGRERLEHYLEKALAEPRLLERLDADPVLAAHLADLFEHSQYFGDQLLRYPELLDELDGAAVPADEPLEDAPALRRYFRRRMMRIQGDSIFGRAPIFATLEQTSDLADSVVAAAYRIAVHQSPPPPGSGSMMVVTLGRLGMREFDLASDADLVFVIPDTEAPDQKYWTGVAERVIQNISAYTGEGVIFTVDTRLRPNGREGDLVQTESAYKSYFANKAEAWEGIAHMKSRAVAGDLERATEFLHELQEVDWRRYGQGGRSRKELAQMRARLEKEQGGRNPLKAGMGGYYDIDFVLMYLRLKGAGIFYKVLNTPARIDVIEKMGHLEREDADFLRDAATLYRAIDHGMRVATGHAAGSLPTAQGQFEVLTELVSRWVPEGLLDQRLDAKVAEIRRGTRAFFNRVFGC
jgi:glutamate-ammonia-ligase adenylyltransferase